MSYLYDVTNEAKQEMRVKYVTPDKVYVVLGPYYTPQMVVQRADIAKVMAAQVGGSYQLVKFYSTHQYNEDMALQSVSVPTDVWTWYKAPSGQDPQRFGYNKIYR